MTEPLSPRVWNKCDPNVPEDAVYVGRPSKWGNPFKIVLPRRSRARAVAEYRAWVLGDIDLQTNRKEMPPTLREIRAELRGKHLVCWCPLDQPCHADVLLELANYEP